VLKSNRKTKPKTTIIILLSN